MSKVLLAGLFLIWLVAGPAEAYFQDGNDLMEMVEATTRMESGKTRASDPMLAGRYVGVVVTCVDVLLAEERIVLPERTTVGQLCAIVTKWMRAHPEQWADSAVFLIRDALVEVYGVD